MSLPAILVRTQVAAALAEDLGMAGDVTSQAILPSNCIIKAVVRARIAGVLAGVDFARESFQQMAGDTNALEINVHLRDGAQLAADTKVMTLTGNACAILAAERVALNFLGHLSGIASVTARFVTLVADSKARVCDTRKTTPGLRACEKYAVAVGGGVNHRFGLYDAILIKDNHIAAVGDVARAVGAARMGAGHMQKIEVESDALAQIEPAIAAGADVLLLDNMPPPILRKAITLIDGRVPSEASGRVSVDNIVDIAASGVDYISIGSITHSADCLDLGLDIENL